MAGIYRYIYRAVRLETVTLITSLSYVYSIQFFSLIRTTDESLLTTVHTHTYMQVNVCRKYMCITPSSN